MSSVSRGQKQAGKPFMDSNLRLHADDTDGRHIDLIQLRSGALLSQVPLRTCEHSRLAEADCDIAGRMPGRRLLVGLTRFVP